jgi:hypothetical protein
VELSPAEQEIYRSREVDLAVLPDRIKFLEEIQRCSQRLLRDWATETDLTERPFQLGSLRT